MLKAPEIKLNGFFVHSSLNQPKKKEKNEKKEITESQ